MRAINKDLYTVTRFRVSLLPKSWSETGGTFPEGFFKDCNIPEYSVEVVEFREGTRAFSRKQPGLPEVNNIILRRGVVIASANGIPGRLYDWMQQLLTHNPYKADLIIEHFHRAALAGKQIPDIIEIGNNDLKPKRVYILREAQPKRVKVASDLDANSGDIALEELEVGYEWFEVKEEE